MKVNCIFEELDWQGKVVKRKQSFNYNFDVSKEKLMKASIEGNAENLPFPVLVYPSRNSVNEVDFLERELDISRHNLLSLKKAYADFPRWRLHFGIARDDVQFTWEMRDESK